MTPSKKFFEDIYRKYNKKEFIYSDPLQFPKLFKEKKDIEIAALISSSLAYGNVKQIIKSLKKIFEIINKPYEYVINTTEDKLKKDFHNFKYRFTTSKEIINLILNLKEAYNKNEDLNQMFSKYLDKNTQNVYQATILFLKEFIKYKTPTLIPDPDKKSAMKRFNLFLRWVIRKDEIDFGIWGNISPSLLIIPLDTHILSISQKLNITKRKDNSIKTALEITEFFKKINYSDPAKYDFALTRASIVKNFIK